MENNYSYEELPVGLLASGDASASEPDQNIPADVYQDIEGVFSWGLGKWGQLGHGMKENEPSPKLVRALRVHGRPKQIACGYNVMVILMENGQVFTCGSGFCLGLGRHISETHMETTPRLVSALVGIPVKQVACGGSFVAAVTESGKLYTWGRDITISGGYANTERQYNYEPKLHDIPFERIVQVACGRSFIAVLAASGKLYFAGSNAQGQISASSIATTFPFYSARSHFQDFTCCAENVQQVSCGYSHTVWLTRSGQVFSMGEGADGRLGRGKEGINFSRYAPPSLLQFLEEDADSSSEEAANNSNNSNDDSDQEGRKGSGRKKANKERIVQIACGQSHTACVAESGALYVFGSNEHGKLGVGDTVCRDSPTQVTSLRHKKVTSISCGYNHTAAITQDGEIYVWGSNQHNQLGHRADWSTSVLEDQLYPQRVQVFLDRVISHVCCGEDFTCCIARPRSNLKNDLRSMFLNANANNSTSTSSSTDSLCDLKIILRHESDNGDDHDKDESRYAIYAHKSIIFARCPRLYAEIVRRQQLREEDDVGGSSSSSSFMDVVEIGPPLRGGAGDRATLLKERHQAMLDLFVYLYSDDIDFKAVDSLTSITTTSYIPNNNNNNNNNSNNNDDDDNSKSDLGTANSSPPAADEQQQQQQQRRRRLQPWLLYLDRRVDHLAALAEQYDLPELQKRCADIKKATLLNRDVDVTDDDDDDDDGMLLLTPQEFRSADLVSTAALRTDMKRLLETVAAATAVEQQQHLQQEAQQQHRQQQQDPSASMSIPSASDATGMLPYDLVFRIGHANDNDNNNNKKVIYAHRAILSARTEYFRAMFGIGMAESSSSGGGGGSNKIIEIELPEDVSYAAFQLLMEYIYTDAVLHIPTEIALELYMLANQYAFYSLEKRCEEIVQTHVDETNAYDVLIIADMLGSFSLRRYCIDVISLYEIEKGINSASGGDGDGSSGGSVLSNHISKFNWFNNNNNSSSSSDAGVGGDCHLPTQLRREVEQHKARVRKGLVSLAHLNKQPYGGAGGGGADHDHHHQNQQRIGELQGVNRFDEIFNQQHQHSRRVSKLCTIL